MSGQRATTLPDSVLTAFFGLLPIGVVLGVLFGVGILPGAALSWIVLGSVAIFVIWAVPKLDPRSLAELDRDSEEK